MTDWLLLGLGSSLKTPVVRAIVLFVVGFAASRFLSAAAAIEATGIVSMVIVRASPGKMLCNCIAETISAPAMGGERMLLDRPDIDCGWQFHRKRQRKK